MDHNDVLATLSPQQKAHLIAKSDAKGLRHLILYLAAIAISTIWIISTAPFWGLAMLVQGILLSFLFTLCHECTHQTPFKSKTLNEWVGWLSGAVILLPFQWFRYFHLAHHRHTNDPENDPELASAKPDTWRAYVVHVSGLPYWISQIQTLLSNAGGRASAPYLPKSAKVRIRAEARWLLVVYALLLATLFASPALLYIWIIPALIGQPFLRLYLLAEHGRCPPVANMLENTRTTFTNRVVRFLAWNMPYHIEHHSFPAVPFHALPRLHDHMQNDLVTTAPGYAAFTREYAGGLGQPSNKGI